MKHLFFMLAALAVGVCAGCTSKEDAPDSDHTIRIAPLLTRVTGLNFDTGDRIGLTVERADGRYADNAPLTYDGAIFSAPGLIWYNDLHETSTLWAYYPFTEEGTPTRFAVRTDQRSADEFGTSDLLAAVRERVTPASTAVQMQFSHLLTRLVVRIDNRSSASVERTLVAGTIGTAEVDVAALHAAADATAPTVEITARETESGKNFEAILVPQSVRLTVAVLTSDGKRHEKTLSEARELRQGCRYTLDIVLTDIDIALSLGGEILDWDDGGTLDDPVNEVRHGDDSYRIHTFDDGTVWMAENLRYLPASVTPSDNPVAQAGVWYPCSPELTAATDEATIRALGYLYDAPTALGGIAITDENIAQMAGIQGICPDGWHLPTSDDLDHLTALLARSPDLAETFLTRTGIRTAAGNYSGQYVGSTFSKGYLMGSSPSDGSINGAAKFRYLCIQSGGSMTVVEYAAEAGVPIRCVRD